MCLLTFRQNNRLDVGLVEIQIEMKKNIKAFYTQRKEINSENALNKVNNPEFLEQVTKTGKYLFNKLNDLKTKYSIIGDVRGEGLMIGMEIVDISLEPDVIGSLPADGEKALSIKKTCFEKGLIVELGGRFGGTIRFLPPLTITIEQIDQVVEILESSIKENL